MPGHPMYEVSDHGRLRSWKGDGSRPRLMNPSPNRGYLSVLLDRKFRRVHRMVAMAFLGPPPFDRALVRHLNDDPLDNRVSNLAWGNWADNARDRKRNGSRGGMRGESHYRSRLNDAAVRDIRAFLSYGFGQSEVGRWYGMCPSTIHYIGKGKLWSHVD